MALVGVSALAAMITSGRVTPDARVTVINGPIGLMRQELRLWLLAGNQDPGKRDMKVCTMCTLCKAASLD
jgi:hypothetical protein